MTLTFIFDFFILRLRSGECIFSGYVCDGETDCSNGADEPPLASCENHDREFTKQAFVRLVDKEVESWTNRNLAACLRLCVNAKDFLCRGVNHNTRENVCVLLENNVGRLGSLEQDYTWNYYERISTALTCSGDNKCESGKCLNGTQFCDGTYDCPDKRDEEGCGWGTEVEVRLVNGRRPHEGRVEIRGYGHGWGGVCDDGWGEPEATVMCRMLGYRLGAREAALLSRFGATESGRINLDEVDCTGEETDILECKFNPWGDHDCSAKEFAGVVCIDEREECGEVFGEHSDLA